MILKNPPDCPYCGAVAKLARGAQVYPHRPDLSELWMWQCAPCDAYVGTHRGDPDHAPMGRLAKAPLRALKVRAHAAFDPLHRDLRSAYPDSPVSGYVHRLARSRAYAWLAERMGIPESECHIAMFDELRCQAVIDVIETLKPTALDIRLWAKQKEIA